MSQTDQTSRPAPTPAPTSTQANTDLKARLQEMVESDTGPHDSWIGELAAAATASPIAISELRSIATEITWISRRLGHPLLDPSDYCADTGVAGLIHLYSCGQRLRYDFNFAGLTAFLERHSDSPYIGGDALIQSFDAFAKLGARQPGAIEQLNRTLALADLDVRARHVCLGGIWSAHTFPEQATLLLDLANRMIELGEADGNVYFRRAMAYRLLNRFTEALDDIDHAFTLLPPGNNEIHQDYLRERQLVSVAIQAYNLYQNRNTQ